MKVGKKHHIRRNGIGRGKLRHNPSKWVKKEKNNVYSWHKGSYEIKQVVIPHNERGRGMIHSMVSVSWGPVKVFMNKKGADKYISHLKRRLK